MWCFGHRRWWLALGSLVILELRAVAGVQPAPPPASAIIVDATSGASLREEDADRVVPVGSLGQLMLLLLSLEQSALNLLPLEAPITVNADAAPASDGASGITLRADRTYRLDDLLKAMVLTSAPETEVAIAEAIAGSVPMCLDQMNARAARLGMRATHFSRIAGLAPSPAEPETTTARDVALMAAALVRYPTAYAWSSLSGLPFDGGSVLLKNGNLLLGTVAGVDGLMVSTGGAPPVRPVGYGVVATAERRGLRLLVVVLDAADSGSRYRKAAEFLEWGYGTYERLEVMRKGERLNLTVLVRNGTVAQFAPVAADNVAILRRRDEDRTLEVRFEVPGTVTAPVALHQALGQLIVEERGRLVAVVPVVSPISISAASLLASEGE